MSQIDQILKHFRAGRTLTPLQALESYDCLRLSARIGEIRTQYGHDSVYTEMIRSRGKRIGRYHPNTRLLKRQSPA
jgi:hypothetical protein